MISLRLEVAKMVEVNDHWNNQGAEDGDDGVHELYQWRGIIKRSFIEDAN